MRKRRPARIWCKKLRLAAYTSYTAECLVQSRTDRQGPSEAATRQDSDELVVEEKPRLTVRYRSALRGSSPEMLTWQVTIREGAKVSRSPQPCCELMEWCHFVSPTNRKVKPFTTWHSSGSSMAHRTTSYLSVSYPHRASSYMLFSTVKA